MKQAFLNKLNNHVAILFVLSAMFAFAHISMAQVQFKIQQFSSEDGLSHRRVSSIIRDKEGFMWFGTWNGIDRFDGRNFRSFKNSSGAGSQPFQNDRINELIDDSRGSIWIITFDKYLYRFDKRKETFISVSDVVNSKIGKKVAILRLSLANDGKIWVISDQGVLCFTAGDSDVEKFVQYNSKSKADYSIAANHIFLVYSDSENNVWIANGGGLSRFKKGDNGTYKKFPFVTTNKGHDVFTKVSENHFYIWFTSHTGAVGVFNKKKQQLFLQEIPGESIVSVKCSRFSDTAYMATQSGRLLTAVFDGKKISYSQKNISYDLEGLFEDSKGNLWIEIYQAGVALLKKGSQSLQYFKTSTKEHFPKGSNFKAFEDLNGTVWVCYSNGELCYFDEAKEKMIPALPLEDDLGTPFLNAANRIYYDDGVVWVGSETAGIYKVIVQKKIFRLEDLSNSDSYLGHEVRCVYFDRHNRRWSSTRNGQLQLSKNGISLAVKFNGKPLQDFDISANTILEDSKGNLWVGTNRKGLYKAIPKDARCTDYLLQYYPLIGQNGREGRVYSIIEDQHKNVWIGTYSNGVFLARESKDQTSFLKLKIKSPVYDAATFEQVRSLAVDTKGLLWIATTGGIVVLQPQPQLLKYKGQVYRKSNAGLNDNDVFHLYADPDGSMWASTAGGGVSHISQLPNGERVFTSFSRKEGLLNDYVFNTIKDREGNLWMATEGGLAVYNKKTKSITNYDSYDGFPDCSFSEGTSVTDSVGNLYFATSHGILSFTPGKLHRENKTSAILFSGIEINNKEMQPGSENRQFAEGLNFIDRLRLPYNENTIAINYAIADYRRDNHLYAYRLSGLSNQWTTDRSGRAVFADLTPGKYVFEVRGEGEGYSASTYRKLAITITPPFWRTWWAYLFYIIIAACIAAVVRRNIISTVRLRNKIAVEKGLSEVKANFFNNISHELRTPLTLIINPLEQLKRKESFSKDGVLNLEVITKNAHRMMHFINQLLDLRKLQSNKTTLNTSLVDLATITRDTLSYFEASRQEKNITVHQSIPGYVPFWGDGEKIKTVIYNLLSNAFKYTPEGKAITVTLENNAITDQITIKVEDEGPGVPEDQLGKMFDVFQTGTAAQSAKSIGLGLALCKELVALHGGKIIASNSPLGGLIVKVTLGNDKKQPLFMPDKENGRIAASGTMQTGVSITSEGKNEPLIPFSTELPRVLLVEDNDDLREFLTRQLSEYYQITTASDGEAGYAAAKALQPDLILSDVMMPRLTGLQMLDKIRKDVDTSHIPVVLLTAKSSVESQIEGLRYGADYYIPKPFNTEFLLTAIEQLIFRRREKFNKLVAHQKEKPAEAAEEPKLTAKDEVFLKEVIGVVEEKMSDYNFNIEAVAEGMNMGRTTFYKKFKSLTGVTPVEFVRNMRLDKAKQYLDEGTNVSEAAYNSGFNNPKYFSTCFKEKFGQAPKDYLQNKS